MKWRDIKQKNLIYCFDFFPVMAFVTYVLVAGVVLGTQNRWCENEKSKYSLIGSISDSNAPQKNQNAKELTILHSVSQVKVWKWFNTFRVQCRFAPETLGMTSSTALVWLVIEILLLLMSMYIVRVSTDLKYMDLLAYCGYKYVGWVWSSVYCHYPTVTLFL